MNKTQVNSPLIRVIANVALFFLLFLLPWWLSLILLCAGIFFFNNFYESFVFALLLDSFHGVPGITFWGTNMFFISIVGAVFVVSIFLKTRLKFYQ